MTNNPPESGGKLSPEATENLLLGEAISRLRREMQETHRDLDGRVEYNARQTRALRRNIERMRLDRQVLRLPNALKQTTKRALGKKAPQGTVGEGQAKPVVPWVASKTSTLLVIAHGYPVDQTTYGGQPLARRIPHYREGGHDVVIFRLARAGGAASDVIAPDGVRVVTADISTLNDLARDIGATQLLIHSPTPEVWSHAKPLAALMPTHVWMHGFESRSWRELGFDFTAKEMQERGPRLDAYDVEKRKILTEIMANPAINTIFVSSFMQRVAEDFAGTAAANGHVIHNIIDLDAFRYRPRVASDRFKLTAVRNFDKRNYASDLMALAVLELRNKPWFDELAIRIIGDGRYFDEDTAELSGLPNVSLERGFVGPDDLATVLAHSGICLVPTRWDSQGMLMGEAMASGLVPVTNAVAAIPEFVDETTAVLAPAEDHKALAAGIADLIENPDRFLGLSKAAFARVKAQCGAHATVSHELALFSAAKSAVRNPAD